MTCRIIGLITNFKFTRILYSKYFGFTFFKAKLSSTDVLKPMNILTGVSIVITSLPMIASAGLTAYYDNEK